MDSLKLLLAIGILSMVFTLVSLGCVAWANSGSRNLSLAMATLSAAMLLFVIQLAFELRASEDTDFISVELTIDRAVPAIRQWVYTTGGWRIHAETEASDWLKANTPDLFNTDTEKVNNDLAMFSLVSYLASNQYDWQLKKTQFKGSTVGTLTTYHRQSSPDECTTFSQEQLNVILLKAGNVFSGSPLRLIAGSLCLPPKTTLNISSAELVLSNPFVSISFAIEPSGSVDYSNPGAIVTEVPQLPVGRGVRQIGIGENDDGGHGFNRDARRLDHDPEAVIRGCRRKHGQGRFTVTAMNGHGEIGLFRLCRHSRRWPAALDVDDD